MSREFWTKLASEILIAIGNTLKDLLKEGMKEEKMEDYVRGPYPQVYSEELPDLTWDGPEEK